MSVKRQEQNRGGRERLRPLRAVSLSEQEAIGAYAPVGGRLEEKVVEIITALAKKKTKK